jgi:ATP-dependent 26S proteasome regulatory subunit
MQFINKVLNYQKAGYPGVFVLTHEEARLTKDLIEMCATDPELSVHEWDAQSGLTFRTGPEKIYHPDKLDMSNNLLMYLQNYKPTNSIFILKDFHLHFDKVLTIRMLRNSWNVLKQRGNMLIFSGHKYAVPGELTKEIQLVDYDLPGEEAIAERIDFIKSSADISREADNLPPLEAMTDEVRESAIEAAKGMTYYEIENALSLAYTTAGRFNNKFVETVFHEKITQLKKNGLLTYMEPNISFENVGGMEGLKKWLMTRKKAYSKDARSYNLPLPKGMLLASVPGTGKSLICKAIAKEFDCPLFALDIGSVFDSLVGNSERNMRELIKTVDSIGKCVILIDEIEKGLSNSAVSGSGDSGVGSRIFGTFLSWLNDRKNPAFIVATTNDHTKLPAALIRKGRFDQLFWVDLPSADERKEIFNVVIKKYGRDPRDFSIKTLVDGAEDFTGAEIEEAFKDALYKAFDAGEEVNDSHVLDVLAEFIPFAESHEEDLKQMRRQAQGKLVMVTQKGDPIADVQKNMRKLSIAIGSEE